MPSETEKLQLINLRMVSDAITRLYAAETYLEQFRTSQGIASAESSCLQLRKAMEAIAFASIAPNKQRYEAFRAKAEKQSDFTKDYHARKIFHDLEKLNKNFYPSPLIPAIRQPDGTFHFGQKATGYLTKKRFEAVYDRLGKHLHADNPWDTKKDFKAFVAELPAIIQEAYNLIELHASFIQTPNFSAVWVIEAPRDGTPPRIITGHANGEFVIQRA